MSSENKVYSIIEYDDSYVQPLILSALEKVLPAESYAIIKSSEKPSASSSHLLQWLQYEEIDFEHQLSNSTTSLCNAYIIRKALIRKHYLSTTIANWITKYPESVLRKHVKPSVEFEVDYAEFLDDALIEAYELKESWQRAEENENREREWWILKPGMSERGQGIRLFSSEEQLTDIFEEWDPPSDDEEEDEEDDDAVRSDQEGGDDYTGANKESTKGGEKDEGNGIITSQLRHFIAQPYIHPPLLLPPPSSPASSPTHKFHIRTYVLAVGALKVYVYKDMLALFAARPYTAPWDAVNEEDALRAHLTNTCLQETNEREGSVGSFWGLPDSLPLASKVLQKSWKEDIFQQICSVTGEVFEAAARSMSIHFQPLPNSFEIFGLDFMIGTENDELTTYLLEVNAFPDFRQTGDELKGLVEGLFEEVVNIAVNPFFGLEGKGEQERRKETKMARVLDIDLGRR
jgi:hypothetical protein